MTRVTFYVVNPTMLKGRKHFVFRVNCYAVKGGPVVAVRQFATIEKAAAFASKGRTIREDAAR